MVPECHKQLVGLDILVPLPESPRGTWYLPVMAGHFTKWYEVVASLSVDVDTIADAIFDHWIAKWGHWSSCM